MRKILLMLVVVLTAMGCITASANDHIPVLLYHDIQTEFESDRAVITVTPDGFEDHIVTLLNNGYTPVSFEDVYNASVGKFTMPEKPIVITFDDGYLTNYTYGFPIIQKHNVKTTIFIVTETVGKTTGNPHFTWEQAKIMQRSGLVSIQSHTNIHEDILTLDNYNVIRELRLSRYMIEKNLGTKCDILAFPFGSCNDAVVDAAHKAGYKVVAKVGETGKNPLINTRTTPFVRVTVYGSWSGNDLVNMINELANQ